MQDDVLSEVLRPLWLTDVFHSTWRAGGQWGVEGHDDSCAIVHYMVDGGCVITFDDGSDPVTLNEGDLAVFPHGTAHTFAAETGVAATPLSALLAQSPPGGSQVVTVGTPPYRTQMLCASLRYCATGEPVLYSALPRLIVIRDRFLKGESLLVRTLEALPSEVGRTAPGSRLVTLRAFETVFVLSLRIAMEQLADESPALQALHHPGISKALMAIHGSYGKPWTVGSLAREAGMSRSVFAQLFRELVGQPPMRHLTLRRLQEARRQLADTSVPLTEIARLIGYASQVGFHLAFRKEYGMTPGEYRAGHRSTPGQVRATA
ncbi:AraC family transcriptional regulator [Streptomyces parvulus]|uniref:AraC family transcriptional regulator n=1 Tax=Streptomyces parvulus TaxID=146923 RepID=A0A191V4A1_9ACTN|nr:MULTISPECIES: AraC family transcriptional regulator [Streptomyces]ANJ09750.1 AraC family transcriptional regulator [Streptomyces parvulus]MCC9156605.1 AraC family transcriptional regulator [Streptomyces parvulus]MCE7685892.1 AraC family transcriptional regulator [Streptomyces parvulus]MCQ4193602.1 AraC family transcriptional regulator [Streptomyces parvulus]MZD58238.1 helix-turn-helix domain-containing protein [Streptomyces sp. SID5606]